MKTFNNSSSEHELELTAFQRESIINIDNSIAIYDSFESFKQSLDDKLIEFATSDLSINDKEFILTYIVTYKVSLDFIANNQDLIRPNNGILTNQRVEDWWDSWGECAAGIAGGAGFVGLVGFGVGGPWGAAVGIILGGAGGAADHC